MHKEFLPYEEALALKELGFDEDGFGTFLDGDLVEGLLTQSQINKMMNTPISRVRETELFVAPLYQQAFRWFRKEHNLDSFVQPYIPEDISKCKYVYCYGDIIDGEMEHNIDDEYNSKDEAELACLKKLIEIVKKKD